MRKSSAIVMTIIILGFGGMMVAAKVALKPLQGYASIATELTAILKNLQLIEPESKVFVLGRLGDNHLAKDGWGLLIELEPSAPVRRAKGRMERLAYRAAGEAASLYHGRQLDWFEIKLVFPKGEPHRSLIRYDEGLRLARPAPLIPGTRP